MSYRKLKFFTIVIPTLLIGGFEFLRHNMFLHDLSMRAGNYFITILTLLISYVLATWMFHTIKQQNLRITNEREMRAIYEERERLAKELHDSIAQTLFLLNVHLKKGKVNEASSLVNLIDTQLRQAIFNLRISPTEKVSFSKKIQTWLEDWSTVSGIDIDTDIHYKDGYFSPAEEVQLFGIIQEACTNTRKHSKATHISFKLNTQFPEWEMVIDDNGCGFQVADVGEKKYGLAMIKERAEKLGAFLDIETEMESGTKIKMRGKKNDD